MSTNSATHIELAKRYAQALFQDALQEEAADAIGQELDGFMQLLKDSRDLQELLESKIIRTKDRVETVLAVSEKLGLSNLMHNFLGVLAENDRFFLFPQVVFQYTSLNEERKGILPVYVTAAKEINDNLRERLEKTLADVYKKKIRLDISVNPDLIGGMTVQVGSRMVDTSIQSKLQKLSLVMKGAGS